MQPNKPTPRVELTPEMQERANSCYAFFATLFVVVLVLTNIIGTKLFVLFPEGGPAWLMGGKPVTLTSGIITYPLTFLLTDIVSEIWGHRRAGRMVIWGFVMSLMMLLVLQVAIALPPSDIWTQPDLGFPTGGSMQRAFSATFANPAILLFASMLAYLMAQLMDVRLYHFWWKVTGGRHMWIRNNGSTMISQLVDTAIVNGIFLHFGLGLNRADVISIIVAVYLCKVALAIVDTPLIYAGRWVVERVLGLEHDPTRDSAPLA
ncbi:MAG TPA: VUT family protein [Planctomycetes bacterium]|nr:VUT family protein [Planctomycetota bacterium]HIK60834.1 VUT family protein [Planctomycetota bacterium]